MNVGRIKRKNTCIPAAQYKRFIVDGRDADITKLFLALGSRLTSCSKILIVIEYQMLWHFQQILGVFTSIVNNSVWAQLWLASTETWQIVTVFNSKSLKTTFLSFLSNNDFVELRLRCHKMPGYNLLLLFVKVTSHEWIQILSNLCYPGLARPGEANAK